MSVQLYLGDCLDVLRGMPAGSVDAVVTDPPYGINLKANYQQTRAAAHVRDTRRHAWFSKSHAAIAGDDKAFDPSHLLAFPTVLLWGANAYADRLPARYSWLVWDKRDGRGAQTSFSDCELCWCYGVSFRSVRIFRHLWCGYQRDSEVGEGSLHPTQKPVALMVWCIQQLELKPGATILDPYMGSGSTGVAAVQLGYSFIGIEIDANYYAIAERRIQAAQEQPRLFEQEGERMEAQPLFAEWQQ